MPNDDLKGPFPSSLLRFQWVHPVAATHSKDYTVVKIGALILVALGLTTLWSPPAYACDLHAVPSVDHRITEGPHNHKLRVPSSISITEMGNLPTPGTAISSLVGASYELLPGTQMGFAAGWVHLKVGPQTRQGFSNPLLFGQVDLVEGPSIHASAGIQFEVPSGADEAIAASHAGVMPYARLHGRAGMFTLQFQLGGLFEAGGSGHQHDHHHEEISTSPIPAETLLLNPHEDSELVYQLSATRQWVGELFSTTAHLGGQTVLSQSSRGDSFLVGGLEWNVPLNHQMVLVLRTDLPLNSNRRITWRHTIGATLSL